MRTVLTYFSLLIILSIASCASSDQETSFNPQIQNPGSGNGSCNFEGDWAIPRTNVFDGGPGCDGIPSIDQVNFVRAFEINYLSDDDLVLVADNGPGSVKIYPHPILDWHEIINDDLDGMPTAIVYCPLTGTGIGWDRTIDSEVSSFGVSGLLYNTNIIPYDRKTGSNWSQQRNECVNGELIGSRPTSTNLVEMRWRDARAFFPDAMVVSSETGFNRNYNSYPYGDYRTNDASLIFPIENDDDRLNRKERTLGVMVGDEAKAYRFTSFAEEGWSMIEDEFSGYELVIIGSRNPEAMVIFSRRTEDETLLDFTLTDTNGQHILTDQEGNVWDIFGRATSGPRVGERLDTPAAMMGYWFSWGTFYPNIEIYGE